VPLGYLCVDATAELAVEVVGLGVVNVLGVLACHDANRRGDDAEFLNRFICLSWPVAVRLFVLVFCPVISVLSLAWALVDDRMHRILEMLAVVLWVGSPVLYYLTMRASLGRIAGAA
jgi:hypothetical protein